MDFDKEKLAKQLQVSKEMMEKTISEIDFYKKNKPNKEVVNQKHITDAVNILNEQLSKNGIETINENNIKPIQMDQNENKQVETKTNKNKKVIELKKEEKKVVEQPKENVIRRDIPENDKKLIEALKKQKEIKVTPSYDSFTPPKTNRKYDVVPLVSKGACYPHKKSSLPVFYLTAKEENLVTSINLYKRGMLIDTILKYTMADEEINPDDLIQADRDAIILFLRSNAYGPEFPIITSNPYTGQEFSTTVSLTQIKYKEFNLEGDENGWFEYKTNSGDVIKFSFPTRKEERVFEKFIRDNEKNIQVFNINSMIEDLRTISGVGFEEISNDDIDTIDVISNSLELIADKLKTKNDDEFFLNVLTEKMILIIKEVNGETDREFIREYVENMVAGEARKFRKYVDSNSPSLDYEVEVTIPEGQKGEGETFTTLLTIGDTIFLDIVD